MIRNSLLWVPIIALTILAGCVTPSGQPTPPTSLSQAEVLTFIDRWVAAEATQDFNKLAPLIHPDAVYRSSGNDYRGIESIRNSFVNTFNSSPDQAYSIDDIAVTFIGLQTAIVIYSWKWTGRTPAGVGFRINGRGTKVLVRDNVGLRLRLIHLNQDTAVAEEE